MYSLVSLGRIFIEIEYNRSNIRRSRESAHWTLLQENAVEEYILHNRITNTNAIAHHTLIDPKLNIKLYEWKSWLFLFHSLHRYGFELGNRKKAAWNGNNNWVHAYVHGTHCLRYFVLITMRRKQSVNNGRQNSFEHPMIHTDRATLHLLRRYEMRKKGKTGKNYQVHHILAAINSPRFFSRYNTIRFANMHYNGHLFTI